MNKIEKLSEIFKAFSDPTRLKLLKMLCESSSDEITLGTCIPGACTGKNGPLCVNAMVNRIGVTQSAVSQHLRILKQAGIVNSVRKGSFVHYSINRENLDKFKIMLKDEMGVLFDIG